MDDYFTRCRLAAYDQRATDHLNPAEKEYDMLATKTLSSAVNEVADFPLARVAAGQPLPLGQGINPAWAAAMANLKANVITPLLGAKEAITSADWDKVTSAFGAYDAWMSGKKGAVVEKLGLARVREILSSNARTGIEQLLEKDKALEDEANNIAAVDKLVRYYRDLFTVLNNFVAFRDFYSTERRAIFQVGTLYLDGRSCELCIKVDDPAKHAALGALSRMYLAYCDCLRRGSNEKMIIVAAFTAGDSDQLMVGRNGVFYDRKGRDWDATISKIVENPISISQAFWSPYRRIGKMIGEQVEKFAASKEKAVQDKAATSIADTGKKLEEGKTAPPPPFDVAKFAGIFAAIGLVIGAIGTALAAVVTGFLGLKWWQIPLAVVGILLLISGPSMVIAYLKLRARNLGPLLDANGWAVNSRARINIPFGTTLTGMADLPPGSSRSLIDPYAEKRRPWKLFAVLLLVLAAAGGLWYKGYLTQWLGVPGPAEIMQTVGVHHQSDNSTQPAEPLR